MISHRLSCVTHKWIIAVVRPARRRGFTLVEMLVVIAIIAILVTLVVPPLRGYLDGYNLTGSADNVTASFALARQSAMARNLPVEMRIYQRDNGNGPAWNTLAVVVPALASGEAQDVWIDTPLLLSGSVVIDAGKGFGGSESYSTLLVTNGNPAPDKANPNPAGPWQAVETDNAPLKLRGLTYVAFRFQPDGATNLPAQDASEKFLHWVLSLRNANARPAPDGGVPAANFVSLVLDPATGHMLAFQP